MIDEPVAKRRLASALARIDELNDADPRRVTDADGKAWSVERLYSERMTQRLHAFAPRASEALQIAARAQHVQRWRIARDTFPAGRTGYKQWRAKLATLHAELAEAASSAVGYEAPFAARVAGLIQKKQLKSDQEAQTLQDVVCLVFIEHYLAAFAGKHADEAVISILQKTWSRMSLRGQAAALEVAVPAGIRALLERAVAGNLEAEEDAHDH